MKTRILALAVAALLGACSHPLEIRNLQVYRPIGQRFARDVVVGVTTPNTRTDGRALVDATAHHLQIYTQAVNYPAGKGTGCDVLADITVNSRHRGSGWNFLINFPGFLVWAPVWNGYIYRPGYDITVDLRRGDEHFDTFTVPVDLDVRHADIDRTWTELAWLEVGAIALVGGAVFTQYDPDITPMVEHSAALPLGRYLAQEIVARIQNLPSSPQPLAQSPRAANSGGM